MKNKSYFWKQKEFLPVGIGYGQFSKDHIVLLAVTVLLSLITVYLYNIAGPQIRIQIRIALAVLLLVSEIIKYATIVITHGDLKNYLPLEICSLAGYCIIIDSLQKDSTFITEMLLILFLPAAIMALIYPTTIYLPTNNIFTYHQFLYHGLIITYVLARFLAGEIVVNYRGVWLSIITIFIIAMIIYFVDRLFNKNFMFMRHDEGNAMLKKITAVCGEGVGYTAGLVTLCIIVIHIFYFLCKILERFIH